jgi:hypothetical protein
VYLYANALIVMSGLFLSGCAHSELADIKATSQTIGCPVNAHCVMRGILSYQAYAGQRFQVALKNEKYLCLPLLIDGNQMRKTLARAQAGGTFEVDGFSFVRGQDGPNETLATAYFDRWLPHGTCANSNIIIYVTKLKRLAHGGS